MAGSTTPSALNVPAETRKNSRLREANAAQRRARPGAAVAELISADVKSRSPP